MTEPTPPHPPQILKSPKPQPSVDQMNQWGIRLVLALRSSMSNGPIKPLDWPSRIVAALETASVSSHFSAMTSTLARKLQTGPLQSRTVDVLRALEHELIEAGGFGAFRHHLRAEAVYIEAWARSEAKAMRDSEEVLAETDNQPTTAA